MSVALICAACVSTLVQAEDSIAPVPLAQILAVTRPVDREVLLLQKIQQGRVAEREQARLRLVEQLLILRQTKQAVLLLEDVDESVISRDDRQIARELKLRFVQP